MSFTIKFNLNRSLIPVTELHKICLELYSASDRINGKYKVDSRNIEVGYSGYKITISSKATLETPRFFRALKDETTKKLNTRPAFIQMIIKVKANEKYQRK